MASVTQKQDFLSSIMTTNGRSNRQRYLFSFVLLIGTSAAGLIMDPTKRGSAGPLGGLITLIVMVAYVILFIRRLHDLNCSGWMALLLIVPIANLVLTLPALFLPGSDGPNRFGPDPLGVRLDAAE